MKEERSTLMKLGPEQTGSQTNHKTTKVYKLWEKN